MVRQHELAAPGDAETDISEKIAYIWHDSVYVETLAYLAGLALLLVAALLLAWKIYARITAHKNLSQYLVS